MRTARSCFSLRTRTCRTFEHGSMLTSAPPPGQKHAPYTNFVAGIESIGSVEPRDRTGPRFREEGFADLDDFVAQSSYLVDVELWDLGINATPFAGQRVLVVGMGNTGAEIALDLCEHCAQTTISIRSGGHIVPRDLFGLPIQAVATVATSLLPLKINDALFPIIPDFALGNLSKHGIKRPHHGILEQVVTSGKIPVLDVGTAKLIRDRRINVMRGLAEILENGAIFADGEERR